MGDTGFFLLHIVNVLNCPFFQGSVSLHNCRHSVSTFEDLYSFQIMGVGLICFAHILALQNYPVFLFSMKGSGELIGLHVPIPYPEII